MPDDQNRLFDVPVIEATVEPVPPKPRPTLYIILATYEGMNWTIPSSIRSNMPYTAMAGAERDIKRIQETGWTNIRIVAIPGEEVGV